MIDVPVLVVPRLSATQRLVSVPAVPLRDARSGAAPRLKTSVRVGMRDGALQVRFDGRDRGSVATYTRRDDPLWLEDVFEIFVTPHEPSHLYYEFEVNPLGALFDARIESPRLRRESMHVETSWDCPGFAARVSRREDRWSALITLPLGPLCGDAIPRRWRANFFRVDRGDPDEFSAWSPTMTDPAEFHLPERFGILELSTAG